MRSAQDEHRPDSELNGYGGHFGSDLGPPSHYGRGGSYEYGRSGPGGHYHHGHDQPYPRGPERNHRDYGLHDTFRQSEDLFKDDWSSTASGPNRPIFPSAAQTKNDIRNDFQESYHGDWGGAPPPPPCSHDSPEFYRSPGPPSNQYLQHDFPHGPSPSSRNWSSPHSTGPPIRGGPPVGAPPLANGPQLHGLPPAAPPPLRGSSPSGGPPPPAGNAPGVWYPAPFYPPPFTSGVSNNISSQHQSGSSQSSAPFFTMDASTRKKLPAWILEGLEKAEREKMKQLEKEERMKRAEEERAKRRDSSSEDEDDGQADDERSRTKSRQSCGADDGDGEPVFLARRANPPVEDLRTDEEKRDDAMASVKFIMMSLLMEATDEVFRNSITESIREMKHEAEPKLLAKSSALAALSTLGGGDESDDESDVGEKSEVADKSRNGGASPSSESEDDNTVFKTPMGVPRKTSKQTTTSAEDPSTEAVTAGDGMESVKANLRRSGKNESNKDSNNANSSNDMDSKRRRRRSESEVEVDLEIEDVDPVNVDEVRQGIATGVVEVASADAAGRRLVAIGGAVGRDAVVRRAIESALVSVNAVARAIANVNAVARATVNVNAVARATANVNAVARAIASVIVGSAAQKVDEIVALVEKGGVDSGYVL
uniref:C3H1-type domain-containing protein n=1 Tax=Angiostrongylus cantonensis TaxID=6313 RepID=A0A0K0DDT7_ANGCA